MIFNKTKMDGVYLIKPDRHEDERGSFIRTFDKKDFYKKCINFDIKQTSLSFNKKRGTLRGMHYQDIPFQEEKIVQCVRGLIYDVVLDLRKNSETYNRWMSFYLSDNTNIILYLPAGVAHGFQTLEDNTMVLYYMNQEYHQECSKTIRYDDIRYGIEWKLPITLISEKDSFIDITNPNDIMCFQKYG